MTHELDALLIRSLPELNDAVTRLVALDEEIGKHIDMEIQDWIDRNGWTGVAELYGDDGVVWLAPKDWMVLGDPDNSSYLYFSFDVTGAVSEDHWNLVRMTEAGDQRYGFWLASDVVKKNSVFKKLWKAHLSNTPGLPLHGAEFFLPVGLDREALASAVLNGSVADALEPLRQALDKLPQLASQLSSFKAAIVASGDGTNG